MFPSSTDPMENEDLLEYRELWLNTIGHKNPLDSSLIHPIGDSQTLTQISPIISAQASDPMLPHIRTRTSSGSQIINNLACLPTDTEYPTNRITPSLPSRVKICHKCPSCNTHSLKGFDERVMHDKNLCTNKRCRLHYWVWYYFMIFSINSLHTPSEP